LSIRLESGLLRISQEALHNVVTHARAGSAHLQLATTRDRVKLVIEDDGVGFNPRDIPEGRFGLQGLNERTRLLGGSLEVRSTPGRGTRVQVVVPND
jgi:two-component system NarL family sensor kinase